MLMRDKVCLWAALCLVCVSLLAGVASAQSTSQQQSKKKPAPKAKPAPAAPKLQLEPKALEILKATSDKLAAAHTLSFTAVELFEHLTRQGAPLGYTTKFEVTLQRPDKLRVLKLGDGPANSFYYDGKSMMGYAPAENLLAVADAPPTIDATMEKAYKLAGIYRSVRRPDRGQSLRRPRSGTHPCVLRRPVPCHCRDHHRHRGLRRRWRICPGLDWSGGQTAAADARGVPR